MKVELIEQLGITPTPGGIDKLLQLQDTQNYYDRGIVNLRMRGSLSSGFDTDDWELDDYNQQIQELKEEKRSLGFSGENSQRKTRKCENVFYMFGCKRRLLEYWEGF